jgi:hypothetical protein
MFIPLTALEKKESRILAAVRSCPPLLMTKDLNVLTSLSLKNGYVIEARPYPLLK